MSLYRPHVPLEVRCAVGERQVARGRPTMPFADAPAAPPFGPRLKALLAKLAEQFGCEVSDLRLDHDPPLASRPRRRRGLGKKTYYEPDANDPDHLLYRPHGAQFEGSHDVKTRIRGDHGQYSDVVLIKRARKRQAKRAKRIDRGGPSRRKTKAPQSRPLKSANRWPPRGSRKFGATR